MFITQEGSSTWEPLPNLVEGRDGCGCGVATNSTGHSLLVVTGGFGSYESIEVLYPSSSEWIVLSKNWFPLTRFTMSSNF